MAKANLAPAVLDLPHDRTPTGVSARDIRVHLTDAHGRPTSGLVYGALVAFHNRCHDEQK